MIVDVFCFNSYTMDSCGIILRKFLNITIDAFSSQSEMRLPLLQVVSSNKHFSVGVQSPTEINAPRGRTLSGRQWFCADRNGV